VLYDRRPRVGKTFCLNGPSHCRQFRPWWQAVLRLSEGCGLRTLTSNSLDGTGERNKTSRLARGGFGDATMTSSFLHSPRSTPAHVSVHIATRSLRIRTVDFPGFKAADMKVSSFLQQQGRHPRPGVPYLLKGFLSSTGIIRRYYIGYGGGFNITRVPTDSAPLLLLLPNRRRVRVRRTCVAAAQYGE